MATKKKPVQTVETEVGVAGKILDSIISKLGENPEHDASDWPELGELQESIDYILELHGDVVTEKDNEIEALQERADQLDEHESAGEILNMEPSCGALEYDDNCITRHIRTDNLYDQMKTEILNRLSANLSLDRLQNMEKWIAGKDKKYNLYVA